MELSIKLDTVEGWAAAKEALGEGSKLDSYFQKAALQELHFLRKKIVEGFKAEAPAGRRWEPLQPITLAIRRFAGKKGTKILQVTRDLLGSITVIPIAEDLGGFVGVARAKARKDGKDPVNIAKVHEGGETIRQTLTAKQRRYIFAAMAAAGMSATTAGAAKSAGGSGTITIRIPPRPFLGPVFDLYAKPEDIERSIMARVCRMALGKLGTPDGGAAPRQ